MPRIALLLLLALIGTGCAGSGDEAGSTGTAETTAAPTTTEVETTATVSAPTPSANDFGAIPDVIGAVEPSVVTILVSGSQGSGSGSGVIWDDEGRIVTNNHVVTGAQEIEVVLATGVQLPAELVGADERTDLAVVEVDREGLPAAEF